LQSFWFATEAMQKFSHFELQKPGVRMENFDPTTMPVIIRLKYFYKCQ